jgi:hypothetical protein
MHRLHGMCVLNIKKLLLEQLQYEAARIITNATRSVPIDCLVKEVGWVSYSGRRKNQNFVTHRRIQLYNTLLLQSSLELWNHLQPSIRNSQTLNIPKSRLNICLKRQQFRCIIFMARDTYQYCIHV